jgi:hypothetical protein
VRLRYDVGTREQIPGDVSMDLRMSLQFQRRPGEHDTELLRSRLFGDVRRSAFRLQAQFVPWQDASIGASPPRERSLQLGLDVAQQALPRLFLGYNRSDRDVAGERSLSQDRRADLSYGLGRFGARAGYRHLDAAVPGSATRASQTREWRGGLNGGASLGAVSVQGEYDAAVSDVSTAARERRSRTHGLNMSGAWNPIRLASFVSSAVVRWSRFDDTAVTVDQDADERYLSGGLQLRPAEGLDFSFLREHRELRERTGTASSDYLQLDGTFRRAIRHGFQFQTGYRHTVTIDDERGDVPSRTAFALLDGRLRDGIDARTEVRASRSTSDPGDDIRWTKLAQLRTRPVPSARFDVTWAEETLPIAIIERPDTTAIDSGGVVADTLSAIAEVTQRDRRWEFSAGYDPLPGASLVLALRILDGHGRVERKERLRSATATWRFAKRASVSANWSRRNSESEFVTISPSDGTEPPEERRVTSLAWESVRGIDLGGWLAKDLRIQASWRGSMGGGRRPTDTYSASLERNF